MADDPKTKPEDGADGEKKKGGFLTSLPTIIGGVMVIEAAALFGVMKFMGGGPDASAAALQAELHGAEGHAEGDGHGGDAAASGEDRVIVPIADVRAHNTRSGRQYLFDVTFFAFTDAAQSEEVKAKIEAYQPLIQDRARMLIGEADPDKLSGDDPGLSSLRRKMLHELEQILGEGAVSEVIVPSCVPFRIDF
jgi:flagellar basal body-associated protein FliL